jgi:SAM-dependent methyltransferase
MCIIVVQPGYHMLNPSFPKQACAAVSAPYVAPESIANRTRHGNESFNTGHEYRLQPVYGDEIWLKLVRAGLTPNVLKNLAVLEVCTGTGFLTFHLLSRCRPKSLTVNDISAAEVAATRKLMEVNCPGATIDWILGDIHTVAFDHKFDVIIGNSFIHHFYNVPQALSRFRDLLKPGGIFISLHEPTKVAPVVEGARMLAYPLAVIAPELVIDIARARYKGEPSATDLWLFEPEKLEQVAILSGFSAVDIQSWGLLRPIVVQRNGLHLSADKPLLSEKEQRLLSRAVKMDSCLNRFLPCRFFGSLCVICRK